MRKSKLSLSILPEPLAICRLAANADIPDWALYAQQLISITRTRDELSIICPESDAPEGVSVEKSWNAFKVEGPLGFSLTGILASLAAPLAEANISIFTVSTFDTEYILVKTEKLGQAVKVLSRFCKIEN